MAATEHVVIEGGIVVNLILIDTDTENGSAYLQGLLDAGDTVLDVSGISPQPSVDWTTSDGGQTFIAPLPPPSPPPPPPPIVAPEVQAQALAQVQGLTETLPQLIAQAQADATTLGGLIPGSPLTAEQVAAFQRNQDGWVNLLGALGSIVAAAGMAAPPPGA